VPIALSEDHQLLAQAARSFLTDVDALGVAHQTLDAETESMVPYWAEMANMGWTSLHLPESVGGQGYGIEELAVVIEEIGRAVGAGAFLTTVVASAVIDACGSDALRTRLLPALGDGSIVGTVGLSDGLRLGGGLLSGIATLVPSAGVATHAVLAVGDDMVVVDLAAQGVSVSEVGTLDSTRLLSDISLTSVSVGDDDVLAEGAAVALRLLRTLATAEAAGVAHATTDMAVEYAKVREQFGQIIGAFQAVKHHCANMLVDAELATALAWEAAQHSSDAGSFAAAAAAAYGLPAAVRCAQKNIQIHGGIGFTWEHTAHLYLRRAHSTAALLSADDAATVDVVALSGASSRTLALPVEAEEYRREARSFMASIAGRSDAEINAELIRTGYILAHLPKPYGRGAGPVEQIVIEEELGDLATPDLGVGSWIVPSLIQCGNEEQLGRWITQSLDGTLRWCQLFSEPNAGSDAAAIQTRGRRTEGGWIVTGQKVWTSGAMECNRGMATVRTDPDAPKHAGVTMMAIDMEAPGVEVRPLREITGESMFNEVFMDEVFVSDDDVIGEVGGGWNVARATLGNERVTIGGGQGAHTYTAESLLASLEKHTPGDIGRTRQVGHLLAEAHGMHALHMRNVERAIGGHEPGPEGNITKLLSAEHAHRVTELGFDICEGHALRGEEPELIRDLLFVRCLSIAGGTSEISRNQIAERLLGLPR